MVTTYSNRTGRVKPRGARPAPTFDGHARSAHNPNQLHLPFANCERGEGASDAVTQHIAPRVEGTIVPRPVGVYAYLHWLGIR